MLTIVSMVRTDIEFVKSVHIGKHNLCVDGALVFIYIYVSPELGKSSIYPQRRQDISVFYGFAEYTTLYMDLKWPLYTSMAWEWPAPYVVRFIAVRDTRTINMVLTLD